jgi:hypothetical protein
MTYGGGCIDPCFLDLGTSWRWVVRTTWRTENSWFYRGSNSVPSVVQSVASLYTDWATPARNFTENVSKWILEKFYNGLVSEIKSFLLVKNAWRPNKKSVVPCMT